MVSNKDLVEDILKRTNLTRDDATEIVDAFVEAMTYYLSKGEAVHILNFGTFETRKRAPRLSHNVSSRKQFLLKEQQIPFFKASKGLKIKLNK